MLAYFKVYRIIRRHYNQIQGSGLFQNFSPPSIGLAKYNKPVASMLCILLLFSICVLLRVISTTVSEYVNLKRLAREDERTVLYHGDSQVLIVLSSSFNPGLYHWRIRNIRNGVKPIFRTLGKSNFRKSV